MSCKHRAGFTIVELLVVIVIMVILLALTVVNMASQQSVARDNERRTKAENIARGLERYYSNASIGNGEYPDLATAASIVSLSRLPDVDSSNYYFSFNNNALAFTVTSSSGTTLVSDAVAASQATVNTTIIYMPMTYSTTNAKWEACDSAAEDCSRFALAYLTESSGVVTIASREQQ